MKQQRIQISTRINCLDEHLDKQLKSFVQKFLWSRGVGCHIQRIRHENTTTTVILFEAEAAVAYAAKNDLIEAVSKKFPQLPLPPNNSENWIVEPSIEKLFAAKIAQTDKGIRRDDSSGALSSSLTLEEPDLDALYLTSSLRRALLNIPGINVVSRVLWSTGKLTRTVVYLHYGKRFITLDITVMDWDMVKETASRKLNISLPVTHFWCYVNGHWGTVADIESFQHEHYYYITAETDPDPSSPPDTPQSSAPVSPEIKFTTMDEFYDALRADGLDENDVEIIRAAFVEQRIRTSLLPRLTDMDLREYGLVGGLRKSVLLVLGK